MPANLGSVGFFHRKGLEIPAVMLKVSDGPRA